MASIAYPFEGPLPAVPGVTGPPLQRLPMSSTRLPRVAIVGRPNVGKSTLFNRVVGRRQAIVSRESGMTRDRQRAPAEWGGRAFELVDTGGVEWGSEDEILAAIQNQAFRAADEAELVLLVVDARQGLVAIESQLAAEIRKRDVPAFLVVNKCDGHEDPEVLAADFHALGIERLFPVSAEHGEGVGDLLDAIIAALPEVAAEVADDLLPEGTIRVAVVGRPNVGKSSLVNCLLGEPRVIVSSVSGTTRDPIDTLLEREGQSYLLVDTAGIRRSARQEGFAEWVSVNIARRRMNQADVALLVVDAAEGLSRQDVAIAAEAEAAGCGLVVVVNKWDLIEATSEPLDGFVRQLRARMGRMAWARFSFGSALECSGVEELLAEVRAAAAARSRRVPTAELNQWFEWLRERGLQTPPGAPRIKYMTQAAVDPPTFIVFLGGRGDLPDGYVRYIENLLRDSFDLVGSPLRVRTRRGRRD